MKEEQINAEETTEEVPATELTEEQVNVLSPELMLISSISEPDQTHFKAWLKENKIELSGDEVFIELFNQFSKIGHE